MAELPKENVSIHFVERPQGEFVPEKQFRREVTPAPKAEDVKDGQILVETLYASIDPAMRPRMNGNGPSTNAIILSPYTPRSSSR